MKMSDGNEFEFAIVDSKPLYILIGGPWYEKLQSYICQIELRGYASIIIPKQRDLSPTTHNSAYDYEYPPVDLGRDVMEWSPINLSSGRIGFYLQNGLIPSYVPMDINNPDVDIDATQKAKQEWIRRYVNSEIPPNQRENTFFRYG